jgi:hypothetical protein
MQRVAKKANVKQKRTVAEKAEMETESDVEKEAGR